MPYPSPPNPLPPSPWSPRATLAGKRLMVTGATGFLGKVFVALLLDQVPEIGRIVLVARGKRREDARARFRAMLATSPAFRPLRARHGDATPAWFDERVEVVSGDVSRPRLGLDEGTRARLRGRLDAVVHVAGITDFDPDPQQALRTNVMGARHAGDVAAELAGGRLLHVSTAYVVGRVDGEVAETLTPGRAPCGAPLDVDAEMAALEALCAAHDRPSVRRTHARERAETLGWPNVYTYSKGLAEHHLATRRDVDPVFLRPTIIESARRFPLPGWVEGIDTSAPIIWLLSGWLRALPAVEAHHFDVVPVDDVARGMVLMLAAHLEGAAPRVAHVGSSDTNPMHFDRAIELTALGARQIHARSERRGIGRRLLPYIDAVARPYDEATYPLPLARRAVRGVRRALDGLDPAELLPPRWHRRFGAELDARRRRLARECRSADRTLGRVEEILRSYRPFTHDHDWVFRTDVVRGLTARLAPDERGALGVDLRDLDWRRYWLDVQVPGVERWSFPLFDGQRARVDPEPGWYRTERGPRDRHPRGGAGDGSQGTDGSSDPARGEAAE